MLHLKLERYDWLVNDFIIHSGKETDELSFMCCSQLFFIENVFVFSVDVFKP